MELRKRVCILMNNYEDVMERKREEIRVLSDYLQIYFEKKTLNSIR